MRLTGQSELIQEIRLAISQEQKQAISFRDYMELCLYHKLYGYYMRNESKIGKEGDFYTSSSIGQIMGEMLAKWMLKQKKETSMITAKGITIVEWGGGTGRMANQILSYLRTNDPIEYQHAQYILIEASDYHRDLQMKELTEHAERIQFKTEKEWLLGPAIPGAFVLANELLDAFPVHRVVRKEGQLYEIYVAWDEQGEAFAEAYYPIDDGLLQQLSDQQLRLAEGQVIEVNLEAPAWIHRIGGKLQQGTMVLIDYGHRSEELYAKHRMHGTLMCYHKHQAHDNPYIHVGQQDITAHVDFTACEKAGSAAGFQELSYCTQTEFLVTAGILEELQEHDSRDPFSPVIRRNRTIRQLLFSDQMGDTFKVLVMHKHRN
jgi:SAM-dependent MidA family methyltransferase